jgi:hypothetical protein
MNQLDPTLLADQIASATWLENNSLGDDPEFYRRLGDFLCDTRGGFLLVQRICPFSGSYTSPFWLQLARAASSSNTHAAHWLGTNVTYYRSGVEKTGRTVLFWFDAKNSRRFFDSVATAFEWAPPNLDDFAATTHSCSLLAYSNRHENEFMVDASLLSALS